MSQIFLFRGLKVWIEFQEWALLKEHAWQVCIAFRIGHPANQTGKGTSLKQNCNEGQVRRLLQREEMQQSSECKGERNKYCKF